MPVRLREAPVVLLSFVITLVGRLYRRWSSLYHSLPALIPRRPFLTSSSSSTCSCTSAVHHSHGPSTVPKSSSSSTMPPLTHLPKIEALSTRVIRVLGLNGGSHTLQGTNTYLVGSGKARILIDTGEGRPGYAQLVKEALAQAGAESIETILLTHHHYDHVGGLSQIRAAFGPNIPAHKWLLEGERKENDNVQHIENGQVFRVEGATLQSIYTPGHTADHVAFYLEEEDSLFSGDCILGDGRTTVFDELYSYMQSLHRLKERANKAKTIYPGHGGIIRDPLKIIEGYINHRNEREAQILAVLQQQEQQHHEGNGAGGKQRGLTPLQIVNAVYEDLPVGVVASAQWNVEHHLDKLQREGKVQSRLGFWFWQVTEKATTAKK